MPTIFQVSKKHVKKEISQQIHEKAMPFVEWLRTAEEETSEEEEEDEVEVVYSEKQAGPSITAQPQETSEQVSGKETHMASHSLTCSPCSLSVLTSTARR